VPNAAFANFIGGCRPDMAAGLKSPQTLQIEPPAKDEPQHVMDLGELRHCMRKRYAVAWHPGQSTGAQWYKGRPPASILLPYEYRSGEIYDGMVVRCARIYPLDNPVTHQTQIETIDGRRWDIQVHAPDREPISRLYSIPEHNAAIDAAGYHPTTCRPQFTRLSASQRKLVDDLTAAGRMPVGTPACIGSITWSMLYDISNKQSSTHKESNMDNKIDRKQVRMGFISDFISKHVTPALIRGGKVGTSSAVVDKTATKFLRGVAGRYYLPLMKHTTYGPLVRYIEPVAGCILILVAGEVIKVHGGELINKIPGLDTAMAVARYGLEGKASDAAKAATLRCFGEFGKVVTELAGLCIEPDTAPDRNPEQKEAYPHGPRR